MTTVLLLRFLGAEPMANDVNAVGQDWQGDSDAVSEGQAMVCSEDECPIALGCELCNAEVALSQAYSVNAVTPVVKQRLKSAQSARSAFTKGGNDSGKPQVVQEGEGDHPGD